MSINKPIILITIDSQEGANTKNPYSKKEIYSIKQDYSTLVGNNGGIPLFVPYEKELIEEYIKIADGIIFSGGAFEIKPDTYKEPETPELIALDEKKYKRYNFESSFISKALKTDVPILGICAGEQMLNICLGGTLMESIEKDVTNPVKHDNMSFHDITINKDSKLFQILNEQKTIVNSNHIQAIKKLGEQIMVAAMANDGVIEAIEYKEKKFAIGVQWHPEADQNNDSVLIIKSFINAAIEYKNIKS